MVSFHITKQSADRALNYLIEVQQRIFAAIREGMGEEVQTLAQTAAGKMQGNPITQHTGRLLAAVLRSPKVYENVGAITGTVGADEGALNLGLWLEEGHRFPNQRQKILERSFKRNIRASLTPQKLDQMRAEGGRVKPYPFLVPSLEEREVPILEKIRQKVADAIT